MVSGSILVEIIAGAVLPNVLSVTVLLKMAWILSILAGIGIAGLAAAASGIWGLTEGIQILIGGDAGLARKGYTIAAPVVPMNNMNMNMNGMNMNGQPMSNQQMNQPMQPMNQMNNGYSQPMNNQPENQQPTAPQQQ